MLVLKEIVFSGFKTPCVSLMALAVPFWNMHDGRYL
jgi:hypothetical protein